MDRISVLLVAPIDGAALGGQAKFGALLAHEFQTRQDMDFHVLPLPIRSRISRLRRFTAMLQSLVYIVRFARRSNRPVVHIFSPCNRAGVWEKVLLALAAKLSGAKVIFNFRNAFDLWYCKWSKIEQRTIVWLLGKSDVILCQYSQLADFFRDIIAVEPPRIEVIGNGIDLSDDFAKLVAERTMVCGSESDVVEILFIGQIGFRKGIDILIRAAAILKTKGLLSRFRVRIFGDAPDKDSIEKVRRLIHELEVTDCVELNGPVTGREKARVFSESDILVLPSRAEGFPNVVLEAMLAGLPVVASSVGAISEIIENGRNGFVTDVDDSKAVAEGLERLIRDRELRREMGSANRAKIKEMYSMNVIAAKFESLYRQVI